MGWLDQVPRAGALYIGGLFSLRRRDAVKEAGLTHVVSVMRWKIDQDLIAPYKHLQIDVDDDEDENLIENFATTNKFIDDALEAGGRVFVHCAMGKSRSATVVIAYLMFKYHISPDEALAQLREARGVCEPNPGFWDQLQLYHKMRATDDVEQNPAYQRWLFEKELASSRNIRQAPSSDKIRFEDEHMPSDVHQSDDAQSLELKCRKCRRTLATSQFVVEHKPKQVPEKDGSLPVPQSACAHFFVEPLSWMRPTLERSELEGRLECPKCGNNIDEVRGAKSADRAAAAIALGIRLPPGRGPGKENL